MIARWRDGGNDLIDGSASLVRDPLRVGKGLFYAL